MSENYTGLVRKLMTATEQQEIENKFPIAALGVEGCSMKTAPSWFTRHCWTCTRPAHHDGPHVAHRDHKPVAIWGSPRKGERPQWLITPAVGVPLLEEMPRR